MVKSFIVFSTLNLSRQSDRERLCVTVSSLKSGKKKRKKGERKRRKRSENSSDAPGGHARWSVTPWHNGTQLLPP